jgi:hypothetical protein
LARRSRSLPGGGDSGGWGLSSQVADRPGGDSPGAGQRPSLYVDGL